MVATISVKIEKRRRVGIAVERRIIGKSPRWLETLGEFLGQLWAMRKVEEKKRKERLGLRLQLWQVGNEIVSLFLIRVIPVRISRDLHGSTGSSFLLP